MKRILFFMLVSVVIFGCSKDDDEDFIVFMSIGGEFDGYSPDSTLYFFNDGANIVKCETPQINKKGFKRIDKVPYHVQSKTISTGYGESRIIEFGYLDVDALNNTVIALARPHTDENEMLLTVYDYNLDSITSIFLESRTYRPWGNSGFHIINGNNCTRYSEQGKELETITSTSFYYPGIDKYIILDDYNFLKYNDTSIFKINLIHGPKWSMEFVNFITNKPEGETNPPKTILKSYSIKDGIVSITLDVTYYDGAKEDVALKFNIETGDVL